MCGILWCPRGQPHLTVHTQHYFLTFSLNLSKDVIRKVYERDETSRSVFRRSQCFSPKPLKGLHYVVRWILDVGQDNSLCSQSARASLPTGPKGFLWGRALKRTGGKRARPPTPGTWNVRRKLWKRLFISRLVASCAIHSLSGTPWKSSRFI